MKKIIVMVMALAMGVCGAFANKAMINDTGNHNMKKTVAEFRKFGFEDRIFIVNETEIDLNCKVTFNATFEKEDGTIEDLGSHSMKVLNCKSFETSAFKGYSDDEMHDELGDNIKNFYKYANSYRKNLEITLNFFGNNDKVKIEMVNTAKDDLFITVVNK